MPKTKISEYSVTNSSNTDIEGINIDEGCAPSGINNAIRELMVHLKEFQTGASGDAFTFAGGVLISGTANTITGNVLMSGTNTITGSTTATFAAGAVGTPSIAAHGDTNTGIFFPAADTIAFAEGGAEAMRIDSSGNLGIGRTSLNYKFEVSQTSDLTVGLYNSSSVTSGNRATITALNSDASSVGYIRFGAVTDNVGTDIQFATRAAAGSLTERMRIDSSGNVGIGTSSPDTKLQVAATGSVGASARSNTSGDSYFRVYLDSTIYGHWYADRTNSKVTFGALANVPLTFVTNDTERARITSGGQLLIGKTITSSTTVGSYIDGDGAAAFTRSGSTNATSTLDIYSTGAGAYRFYVTMDGKINCTSTTIAAISDIRLKENIQDLDVGLDAVMSLRPRKFDWKEGKGKNIKGDRGWIAQEFEQVFPDMISTWKDEAPEGEEPYKAVGADLIPILTKAIQELKAITDAQATRIEALEAEVAALKGN